MKDQIENAYKTIKDLTRFLKITKKTLMEQLKNLIDGKGCIKLKTPVQVEVPYNTANGGKITVHSVSYGNEDCLWLHWENHNNNGNTHSGVEQSWMAERIIGNKWVEKLYEIATQVNEQMNAK